MPSWGVQRDFAARSRDVARALRSWPGAYGPSKELQPKMDAKSTLIRPIRAASDGRPDRRRPRRFHDGEVGAAASTRGVTALGDLGGILPAPWRASTSTPSPPAPGSPGASASASFSSSSWVSRPALATSSAAAGRFLRRYRRQPWSLHRRARPRPAPAGSALASRRPAAPAPAAPLWRRPPHLRPRPARPCPTGPRRLSASLAGPFEETVTTALGPGSPDARRRAHAGGEPAPRLGSPGGQGRPQGRPDRDPLLARASGRHRPEQLAGAGGRGAPLHLAEERARPSPPTACRPRARSTRATTAPTEPRWRSGSWTAPSASTSRSPRSSGTAGATRAWTSARRWGRRSTPRSTASSSGATGSSPPTATASTSSTRPPAAAPSSCTSTWSRRRMQKGRAVKKGEEIAASGNSGHSFAPHLHYQIEDASGKRARPLHGPPHDARESLPAADLPGLRGGAGPARRAARRREAEAAAPAQRDSSTGVVMVRRMSWVLPLRGR